MKLGHHLGRLGHRVDYIIGKGRWVGACETNPLKPLDLARCAQQLPKGECVAKLNTVRVDVLAQQSHLDSAIRHERLNLRQHFARTAIHFFASETGDNTKRAGVVAPN